MQKGALPPHAGERGVLRDPFHAVFFVLCSIIRLRPPAEADGTTP